MDSDYPETLKEGVPLGVDTPTLQSPAVWPPKSELIGEEWDPVEAPPPVGHSNYPSADTFREEIRATFVEETFLGMVIGPCTRSEAAAHCRCKEEDLCPCPMAGIDESDKIRSIFDGSKGGANLRIQQNRVEKTTARTVTVCNQCLRWLRASRSRGNPGALGPEPLEPDDSHDKPPGHAECHGQPPDTMCFSDNRDSSAGSGRPCNFPGPTEEWVLLKADVTKAHRRIKILLQEWRYQVAQLGDEWWVNTVGTYGMASAQLLPSF